MVRPTRDQRFRERHKRLGWVANVLGHVVTDVLGIIVYNA